MNSNNFLLILQVTHTQAFFFKYIHQSEKQMIHRIVAYTLHNLTRYNCINIRSLFMRVEVRGTSAQATIK